MRTALYVLLALAAPAFAAQTVWKWVDDKGVTHYSDQPVPGAIKMELNSSSRSSSPSTPPPAVSSPPPQTQTAPARRGPAYSRFVIESPQPDESIVNTGGKVSVRISSTPSLSDDVSLEVFLDGNKVEGLSRSSMATELSDVPRGSHTLKAVLKDQAGSVIQETPAITFHVRQESIAKPPAGPKVRNPNSPRRSAGNKLRTTQPSYVALNGAPPRINPKTNLPPKSQQQSPAPKAGK